MPLLVARLQRSIDRVTTTYGLRRWTANDLFVAPEQVDIVFLPRVFYFAADQLGVNVRFLGPSMQRTEMGSADILPHFLEDDHRPIVSISLDTIRHNRARFFKRYIAAFTDTPWRVVMAVGTTISIPESGPIPANMWVVPSVPQLALLPRVAVFVTHGGMNSTLEAFYHGVPLIVARRWASNAAPHTKSKPLGGGSGYRIAPAGAPRKYGKRWPWSHETRAIGKPPSASSAP